MNIFCNLFTAKECKRVYKLRNKASIYPCSPLFSFKQEASSHGIQITHYCINFPKYQNYIYTKHGPISSYSYLQKAFKTESPHNLDIVSCPKVVSLEGFHCTFIYFFQNYTVTQARVAVWDIVYWFCCWSCCHLLSHCRPRCQQLYCALLHQPRESLSKMMCWLFYIVICFCLVICA